MKKKKIPTLFWVSLTGIVLSLLAVLLDLLYGKIELLVIASICLLVCICWEIYAIYIYKHNKR